APPGKFRVDSTTASTLSLSWEALPDALLTCNVTSYRVEHRPQGNSSWISENTTSDALVFDVKYLASWTWYEVRVAAVTASLSPGLGPFTIPVVARTQQGESGRITAVSFIVNEESIKLSWQPPKQVHGVLVGYKVSYQPWSEAESNAVPVEILVYDNKSLSLHGLEPDTLYDVRIYAVNGAGVGRETKLFLKTLPATTVTLTTEFAVHNATWVSSEEPMFINDTEINLSQSSARSHIRKNLAAIVAGCLVGAVALTVCTIFVCIKCIRYRRKQRLNYDVSEDRVVIQTDSSYYRPNESSPAVVEFAPSSKPSLPFFTSSSPTSPQPPPPSSSSLPSPTAREAISNQHREKTAPHSYQTQTEISSKQTAQNIENQSKANSQKMTSSTPAGDLTQTDMGSYRKNSGGENSVVTFDTKKSDLQRQKSFGESASRHIPGSKKYSKLDEDVDVSTEENGGFENKLYRVTKTDSALNVDDVVLMVDDSLSSFSASQTRHSLHSFDDTDSVSVSSDTMRRRNRMRTESAAAIAVLRSTIYVDSLDMAAQTSNGILGNGSEARLSVLHQPEEDLEDFGTEVIFNERTVL
ncbi:hypothetical protein EGW08_000566, partial [Elysia chlorotica]